MGSSEKALDKLTTGEWVTVVALVAAGLIATTMFLGWLMERQGLIAPAAAHPRDPEMPHGS